MSSTSPVGPLASDWAAQFRKRLLDLPRASKRAVLVVFDFALLTFCLWLAIAIRLGPSYLPDDARECGLFLAAPAVTVATFGWFGVYKIITRYMGGRAATKLVLCVGLSVLIWALLILMIGQSGIPRSAVVTYAIIAATLVSASRVVAAWALQNIGIDLAAPAQSTAAKPVLIYGANAVGRALSASLKFSDRHVVGFVDDAASLWGQYIGSIKVSSPDKLDRLVEAHDVKEVLIALPSGQRSKRRDILARLEGKPVAVKVMPAIEDIVSGRVSVSDLRPVKIEDLLGRDPVTPVADLLSRNITSKSVLVTGAGGSVGSELVRQIIKHGPSCLVLLDISEAALYEIDTEVHERLATLRGALPAGTPSHAEKTTSPAVVAVIGSVLDGALVASVLRRYRVDTIYHAAAYKHVPLVEANPVAGLVNNANGAAVMAQAAISEGVGKMVLISTDKAVRPTNIMGASKRIAEMVLQAHAATHPPKTTFAIVRFGNVLNSSGSVVRTFNKQIAHGGPLTVTHPDITRYFMSIPEAAELVIQAGALAKGGEVFLLDMGEPVKVADLARLMIRLAGLKIRDQATPDGDIAIEFVGLRPGEKLYEELLISTNSDNRSTEHERIWRSEEPFLPLDQLETRLASLRIAMDSGDVAAIKQQLKTLVDGYQPSPN